MNLFSKMTTKQKENFSFAIFRSDFLTGGYKTAGRIKEEFAKLLDEKLL